MKGVGCNFSLSGITGLGRCRIYHRWCPSPLSTLLRRMLSRWGGWRRLFLAPFHLYTAFLGSFLPSLWQACLHRCGLTVMLSIGQESEESYFGASWNKKFVVLTGPSPKKILFNSQGSTRPQGHDIHALADNRCQPLQDGTTARRIYSTTIKKM